jgi:hypothetical protein
VSAAHQPAAEAIARPPCPQPPAREAWLNPPEWVDWVITPEEEQAGFPADPWPNRAMRPTWKQRTLTNLYNASPAWLSHGP